MRRTAQARVDEGSRTSDARNTFSSHENIDLHVCPRHPAISKLVHLESGRGTTHHSPTAPTDSKGPFFLLWKSSEDVFELL